MNGETSSTFYSFDIVGMSGQFESAAASSWVHNHMLITDKSRKGITGLQFANEVSAEILEF